MENTEAVYIPRKKRPIPVWALILIIILFFAAVCAVIFFTLPREMPNEEHPVGEPSEIADALSELAEKNPEAEEYVSAYTGVLEYDTSITVDSDYTTGKIPYLMQWDSRWGYSMYGIGLIGYTGCGPTCLSMVLVGLTGDTTKTPGAVAAWAEQNGYAVSGNGTAWTLFSEGAEKLGLEAEELPLWEGSMKNALNAGKPIVCIMGPGNFTETGHFIVIHGYNSSGFLVYDPNRRANSDRAWTFEELSPQIRNLWAFS